MQLTLTMHIVSICVQPVAHKQVVKATNLAFATGIDNTTSNGAPPEWRAATPKLELASVQKPNS